MSILCGGVVRRVLSHRHRRALDSPERTSASSPPSPPRAPPPDRGAEGPLRAAGAHNGARRGGFGPGQSLAGRTAEDRPQCACRSRVGRAAPRHLLPRPLGSPQPCAGLRGARSTYPGTVPGGSASPQSALRLSRATGPGATGGPHRRGPGCVTTRIAATARVRSQRRARRKHAP